MKKNLLVLLFLTVLCYCSQAQITKVTGPSGSGRFGSSVTVLTNGNYVVTDPRYSQDGISDVGAVYLYNGQTNSLISKITGSTAGDLIGYSGVMALPSGNFVIRSEHWNNGSANQAGAVTWASGVTGVSGVVSSINSLVGRVLRDGVGAGSDGFLVLPNGNFLIGSGRWHNVYGESVGALTFVSGTLGASGFLSSENSLIGSYEDDGVGNTLAVKVLPNGNYIAVSSSWNDHTGAATLGSGTIGVTGEVTANNSLIGNSSYDEVGSGGIKVLANGNYLIQSPYWSNGSAIQAGAVSWFQADAVPTGTISTANSLVGSNGYDRVGNYNSDYDGVFVLPSGNYVVASSSWKNGALAGAVTWGNGATGIKGLINSSNSLIGNSVGNGGVTVLSNGNYVVSSPYWSNGSIFSVGAVTWGSGSSGVKGTVSSANSLVGSKEYDGVGYVVPLTNGNYVVSSSYWDNGNLTDAGAATWCNGSTGTSGIISSTNSLVGTTSNDRVGSSAVALANGNYVVSSGLWSNGSSLYNGAVTWGNGASGIKGPVAAANSLIGKTSDYVGDGGVLALSNGNYVVLSSSWNGVGAPNAGAVTLGNGTTGTKGVVSSVNSLTGSSAYDRISDGGIIGLPNGNYVISSSSWSSGSLKGAVTWGSGTVGITGPVSAANSLVGKPEDRIAGFRAVTVLSNSNYLVRTPSWNSESASYVGAVTFGNGLTGVKGLISPQNSLIGSTTNDAVGSDEEIVILSNGDFLIDSEHWNNTDPTQRGALTYGKADVGVTGVVTSCNSVTATYSAYGTKKYAFNSQHQYTVVGSPGRNSITIYNPSGISPSLGESQDATSINLIAGQSADVISRDGCRVLALIESTGSSPVQGSVSAKVWVESSVPTYGANVFVARHYQLTPSQDAATATGKVTLYFSQAEFDAFNGHQGSSLDLPTGFGDSEGKSNLRISKFSGVSSDNSGLPASYSGNAVSIDPSEQNIIWNSALSRWEVTFDVTGFSGFFVHTNSTPLPVKLISFTGKRQENSAALEWRIAEAENFGHFQVQRSHDAKSFQTFETVVFMDEKPKYDLVDANAHDYVNDKTSIFYRLKMVDQDGTYAFSRIVEIKFPGADQNYVYPNPFQKDVSVSLRNHNGQVATVSLVNVKGEILVTQKVVVAKDKLSLHFDKESLPVGQYTISVLVGEEMIGLKVIKQQ